MKRSALAFWIIVAIALLCWPLALFAESDGTLTGVTSTPGGVSSAAWTHPGTIGSVTPNTGSFTQLQVNPSVLTGAIAGEISYLYLATPDSGNSIGGANYSRLFQYWDGTQFQIFSDSGGSGTARDLQIGSAVNLRFAIGGSEKARISSSFNFLIGTTSSTGITGGGGLRVTNTTASTSSIIGAAIFGDAATAGTNVAIGGGTVSIGGNAVLSVAGGELKIKEGANASMGTAVLVGGTLVVANTLVTANSRIYLTSQVDGGTPGFLRVSTRTASTSFTILSSSGTDTSTVAWHIVEPAP